MKLFHSFVSSMTKITCFHVLNYALVNDNWTLGVLPLMYGTTKLWFRYCCSLVYTTVLVHHPVYNQYLFPCNYNQPMPVILSMSTKTWHILVYQIMSTCWLWSHLLIQSHFLVCSWNTLCSSYSNPCRNMMVQGVNLFLLCGLTFDDNGPLYILLPSPSLFVSSWGTWYILLLDFWCSMYCY